MEQTAFDQAFIRAAFARAGEVGWDRLDLVAAARVAGLPVDAVRRRFPNRGAILMRFGVEADAAALAGAPATGAERERLFDIVMRRIDAFQVHRAGLLALFDHLPRDPGLTALLSAASLRSMAWLLQAAGIPTAGARGCLRVQGMFGVWLYTLRAWRRDDSPDLPATMAALDRALGRAQGLEERLGWSQPVAAAGVEPPLDPEPLSV